MFFLATIQPDFTVHFTFRIHTKTKKLSAKVLNSNCQTTSVYELWQIVNFDSLTFFDSFSLVQPIRLFQPYYQGFRLAYGSLLYESIEHFSQLKKWGVKRFLCLLNLQDEPSGF